MLERPAFVEFTVEQRRGLCKLSDGLLFPFAGLFTIIKCDIGLLGDVDIRSPRLVCLVCIHSFAKVACDTYVDWRSCFVVNDVSVCGLVIELRWFCRTFVLHAPFVYSTKTFAPRVVAASFDATCFKL